MGLLDLVLVPQRARLPGVRAQAAEHAAGQIGPLVERHDRRPQGVLHRVLLPDGQPLRGERVTYPAAEARGVALLHPQRAAALRTGELGRRARVTVAGWI